MIKNCAWLVVLSCILGVDRMAAHPGSALCVDRHGNVYFVDTGSGVYKIDTAGVLTRIQAPPYHWMALDIDGRLKRVTLPSFARVGAVVERDAEKGPVIVSSDFPIATDSGGDLYYPRLRNDGVLQILRLTASGATTVHSSLARRTKGGELRWLNGMTVSPRGDVYFSEDAAVRKVSAEGAITTVAEGLSVSECVQIPGTAHDSKPYVRGIDVDEHGNVYAAASGCGAVIKITPDKTVSVILRSAAPWSPTAVALSGGDVYVLEYFHTPGENRVEWYPRVRKVRSDGSVVTVAQIDRR